MSQGLFSIGGIASGLDTANIIDQLLKLERQPIASIERQQAALQQTASAWTQVNTKLSSLRTSIDAISRPQNFTALTTVTSSDPAAVSVTRNGAISAARLSFTVERLATTTQASSNDVFTARDQAIGARQLSITVGDVTTDVTAGLGPGATLDDLVAAINDAKIGVQASTLKVSADEYRLVLDSTKTGTAGAFTVSGTGWDSAEPFATVTGVDAQLKVGNITVTRSSNTIDDLVDGATITLRRVTDEPVTVTAARDVEGAVAAVKRFTDALNGVLTTMRELTSYDPATKRAGVLQGDASARQLAMSLRSAFTSPVAGLAAGPGSLPSTIGLSVDRDGVVTVDETKLRAAFTDDWAGTSRMFARTATSDSPWVSSAAGTSRTAPGSYEVAVTTAADIARVVGAGYFPDGPVEPKTFRITGPGGKAVTVTIDTGTSLQNAVNKINEALREAGQDQLVASEHDGQIRLASTTYGSGTSFTVEDADPDGDGTVFGLEGTHRGTNVAGTIGGAAATGSGWLLTAETGPASGLSVALSDAPAGPIPATFSVSFTQGVTGAVGAQLAKAEGLDGIVARARRSVEDQVRIYQTRIDGFEQRLIAREATIRRQFVGMESMLGKLNAQGNWLGQQLAGLANLNAPQR